MADTDDKNGETATEGDTVPESPEDTAEALEGADDSGSEDTDAPEDTGPDEVSVLTEALAAVQSELDETKRQLVAVQAHNYELITGLGSTDDGGDDVDSDTSADTNSGDDDSDPWQDDDPTEGSFDAAWTVKE